MAKHSQAIRGNEDRDRVMSRSRIPVIANPTEAVWSDWNALGQHINSKQRRSSRTRVTEPELQAVAAALTYLHIDGELSTAVTDFLKLLWESRHLFTCFSWVRKSMCRIFP